MGDQAQAVSRLLDRLAPLDYIHLKEISVYFIKRRLTSNLELVFKDATGVKRKSDEFTSKDGDLVYWNLDMYVRAHTSATLIIRRTLVKISIAEIKVEFKPKEFTDERAVGLEDSNHRVSVNFVCGRSQSFAGAPRFRSFQARTDLASKFLQPAALAPPSPASERTCNVPYPAIHWLNSDILLNIFSCYRLDEKDRWNDRLGWRKLCHVCQKWRRLMYESTFYLGMHIRCTNGTPIVDTLYHLPPLPLVVDYKYGSAILTEEDELGIYHALRLHDRVRHIGLHVPPSILHECLVLMDERFPILEHLNLSFAADKFTTLVLPKAFLAPNLRHLNLPGISPPRRLRVLASTVSLVTLVLRNIQTSTYISPRLLLARLWSLPQLEELSIGFCVPIPRPSTEMELLGEQGPSVTLPCLKTLRFKGASAYLECLVAQIRAPLLERLRITLFNQIAFALPHLSHLINITEGLKLPSARVHFCRDKVSITTTHHNSRWLDGPFSLSVGCKTLDWQIDCATQVCGALIPALRGVERFTLDFYDKTLPTEWQNGEIDGTMWHELLRAFTRVKELHIQRGLLEELSRALQVDEVGSEPGFLPDLQNIVCDFHWAHTTNNLFASFIDARRVAGLPVRFSARDIRPRASAR